jgi:hypothetical protein
MVCIALVCFYLYNTFPCEKLSVWEPLMEQVSEKEGQYRPWECVVKGKTNKGNTDHGNVL